MGQVRTPEMAMSGDGISGSVEYFLVGLNYGNFKRQTIDGNSW